ncbi:MAG: SCO family protein [Segetibacter sp.]
MSVDPEHDNIPQLKKYVNRFGINTTNWSLLTGDKKEIYKLARNEFMIVAAEGDGGDEDFIHSEQLVLADQQRRVRGYYDGTNKQQVDQLIHDIKKLQNE